MRLTKAQARAVRDAQVRLVAERLGVNFHHARAYYFADLYEHVYFIRAGGDRMGAPIKIGVAVDVDQRLTTLQTSHHERLELLGCILGDERLERRLHRQFADAHIRGEWFRQTPELLDYIVRKAA